MGVASYLKWRPQVKREITVVLVDTFRLEAVAGGSCPAMYRRSYGLLLQLGLPVLRDCRCRPQASIANGPQQSPRGSEVTLAVFPSQGSGVSDKSRFSMTCSMLERNSARLLTSDWKSQRRSTSSSTAVMQRTLALRD